MEPREEGKMLEAVWWFGQFLVGEPWVPIHVNVTLKHTT